jgi:hypothetical protein
VPGKSHVKVQPEILDIFLHLVNVMLTDLDLLAFILHFLNQYWIAALWSNGWNCPWLVLQYCRQRLLCAIGHSLGVRQHWLGRVLHTQFQILRGSVCYANRILGQGNNWEGEETILTCIGVQYAILCWRLERCLKMLQNSIACFEELHYPYDSTCLFYCGVPLPEAELMIEY